MTKQTGKRGQSKKPWLTYNLKDDNSKRERSRKLMQLSSIFSELGYPVRMVFTGQTLKEVKEDISIPGVEENMYPDLGVIEFQIIDKKTTEEITNVLSGKGIKVYAVQNHKYKDNTDITRVYLQISTIKN